MIGLLIKDLKILSGQKQTALIMGVMFGVMMVSGMQIGFLIGYITFLMTFLTIGTISYDEFDNGNAFLFTLPVTRAGYVREKYALCLGSTVICWSIASVICLIFNTVKGSDMGNFELAASAVTILFMVMLIVMLVLPLQLKFGAEKSRVAIFIVYGAVFAVIYLGGMLLSKSNIDVDAVVMKFISASSVILAVGAVGILLGLLIISYNISVKIMQKKQF